MSQPERTRLSRSADPIASLTLALVGAAALTVSWGLPWWTMEARAPQYGQRALVIQVSPRRVNGDVFEVDTLGHYVGIRPLAGLARLERRAAPLGMGVALVGLLVAPWVGRRRLRLAAVAPVTALPLLFLADLRYWMERSTSERDLEAALNLTVNTIQSRLVGPYEVGQFRVTAELSGGLYLSGLAALLAIGLALSAPLRPPRWLRRARAAAPVVAVVAALALGAAPASAATLDVPAGGAVADALAAARDGDVVVVPAGVHRERLTLARRVLLVGRPGAILDGGGHGTVVTILAPGAELRGLTVRGSGAVYSAEDAAVRIEGAPGARVDGVRIEDSLFGVFVVRSDRCAIERSVIQGKALPHPRRGDGIRLWYSSGCRLAGNRVERSRDVVIWYSAGTRVEDNLVRTSRYGLHFMYSDHNVFRRNRFEDNQVGAAIMYSRGVELRDNDFSFSRGPAAYGLLVKDADDVMVEGNRFVDNATGLFVDGAPQARDGRMVVRRNLVARNGVGLALQPLSRRIELSENAFVGNQLQVQIRGTGDADGNRWAVGGRGNYWSDALPYDADGDGVSELPYRAESTYEALADRAPALAFFQGTPAADAIDAAARLFPLFAPRPRMTDPRPLVRPALDARTAGAGAKARGPGLATAGGVLLALALSGAALARRGLA